MRIMLFAAGGDIGGGKTHILSLAKELAKDNDLRLVSFRRGVLSQEGMEMGIDTVDTGDSNGIIRSIRLAFAQAKAFLFFVILACVSILQVRISNSKEVEL